MEMIPNVALKATLAPELNFLFTRVDPPFSGLENATSEVQAVVKFGQSFLTWEAVFAQEHDNSALPKKKTKVITLGRNNEI